MKELIIWNQSSFIKTLSFEQTDSEVITGSDAFQQALNNINDYEVLIVLCELSWAFNASPTNTGELKGISLVKELRRSHQFTAPVLFVSFLAIEEIFNLETEIITAVGHNFYRLPASFADLEVYIRNEFFNDGKVKRLSEIELADIKSFYCSKEGILSQELHNLNRYLNAEVNADNQLSIKKDLVDVLRKINGLYLLDPSNDIENFKNEFAGLSKENINDALTYIINIGNAIPNRSGNNRPMIEKEGINKNHFYPWKILILDDEINASHDLVKRFNTNNVEVICCENAEKAFEVLNDDWREHNSIMVVIADYRLYRTVGSIRYHQKVQGYQFLKEVAASDQLVRLVAFSGLQRKFLLSSFKHYNIRTEVKSKIDYLADDHTQQLFCDEVIEMAVENWDAVEAMPSKCAGFEKYLKEAYKQFRRHPDYNKWEDNISLTANAYVQEIQQQLEDNREIKINAIENIKSPLAKTKKDDEAFARRFQNYLVARRIALWLYALAKNGAPVDLDSRRIAEILTNQKYPTDAYRQILSTNLGLSLDDFPRNITIEERSWLQYDMKLNIFRDLAVIDHSLQKVGTYFGDFIRQNTKLSEWIRKSSFVISHKYKNLHYEIKFEQSFIPRLKTPTDVRIMYAIIETFVTQHK